MYRPGTVIWHDEISPGLFSLQSIGTEKWDRTREGMAHATTMVQMLVLFSQLSRGRG